MAAAWGWGRGRLVLELTLTVTSTVPWGGGGLQNRTEARGGIAWRWITPSTHLGATNIEPKAQINTLDVQTQAGAPPLRTQSLSTHQYSPPTPPPPHWLRDQKHVHRTAFV